jgi:hypothetical protein
LEEKNECVSGVCVCVVLNSRRGEDEEKKKKTRRKERKKMCCAVPCLLWPVERKRRGPAGRPGGRGSVTYIPLLLSPMEWKGRTTSGGDSQESQVILFSFFFFILLLRFSSGTGEMGEAGEGRA